MKEDISILINSCDKYSDVWEVFFPLFFRYWPDCPWKLYLGSNEKVYNDPRVTTICVGKDKSWADSALMMINKIPTKNILFFLDDFFIFWKVDTGKVTHYYNEFIQLDANYMRLRNSPFSNKNVVGYSDLIIREKGEMYRTALDIAFWKKEVFLDLLQPGENPWQMELEGSKRACKYDGFYTTKEWVIERRNGLEAGKWMRYNLKLIKKEGLAIPLGHKIRSKTEEVFVSIHNYLWTLSAYKLIRKFKTISSRHIKHVIRKELNETTN